MHAKLFIIQRHNSLRVVITSANLCRVDWSDLDNIAYIQDFPLTTAPTDSQFATDLHQFLVQLKAPVEYINLLELYNFTDAKVQLITSVPGAHRDSQKGQYGYLRLRAALASAKLLLRRPYLVYMTSSLGGNTVRPWLSKFVQSTAFESNYVPNTTKPLPMEILFPTFDTVTSSMKTLQLGNCVHLTKKNFDKFGFEKRLLRDVVSKRDALIHSKIIVGCEGNKASPQWAYIGSANATSAAWGVLQANDTQLYLNNFEIGVLFKVNKQDEDLVTEWGEVLPIPWDSATPYKVGQVPWLVTTHMALFTDETA